MSDNERAIVLPADASIVDAYIIGQQRAYKEILEDLVKCLHPTCLEEYITEVIKKYRLKIKK